MDINDGVNDRYVTYINEGGHIFQGNLTSIDELIAARSNPEAHRDLMVRVGGYSARFVTLPPETQDEIIDRYRYRADQSAG